LLDVRHDLSLWSHRETQEVRIAVKCDRCKNLDVPACVRACPTGTLIYATQGEFVEMMRREAAAKIARGAKSLAGA